MYVLFLRYLNSYLTGYLNTIFVHSLISILEEINLTSCIYLFHFFLFLRSLIPMWEEQLVYNESYSHLISKNENAPKIILFFEVSTIPSFFFCFCLVL